MVTRLAAALVLARAGAAGHPMHTSVTEMVAEPGGRVRLAIRLYPDDLGAATGETGAQPADSAVARYLRGRFALRDRTGRPVLLRWDGMARQDDAVIIRLEGSAPGGLPGARVANLILTERFRDQVNVVRASWPGGAATLLFTRGDGGKVVR
jgi:hypothetical protein